MTIDEFNIDESDIAQESNKFLKKYNNIYITGEQIQILKKYNIDINKFKNVNELIFEIESYLNNSWYALADLESVSAALSEYNYYNNTNK